MNWRSHLKTIADLSPEIRERLERLDRPLDEGQIPALRIALKEYVRSIGLAAKKASFIDMTLVFKLQASALEILDQYQDLDTESKKAGSAGIKYFLMRDDALNGFLHPGGFEDDSHVLTATAHFIAARKSSNERGAWAV